MGKMSRKKQSLSEQIEAEVVKPVEARTTASRGTLDQQIEKSRARPKSYVMDLRIHSPASLGYLGIEGLDTAPALVRLAQVKGINVIAVTDFYSGKFVF